jgi:hypothetical protein
MLHYSITTFPWGFSVNNFVVTWLDMVSELLTGFNGLLRNLTTNNYRAMANSCTLQYITARLKLCQSAVLISRCLVTAPNTAGSFVHVLTGSRLPTVLQLLIAATTACFWLPSLRHSQTTFTTGSLPQNSLGVKPLCFYNWTLAVIVPVS